MNGRTVSFSLAIALLLAGLGLSGAQAQELAKENRDRTGELSQQGFSDSFPNDALNGSSHRMGDREADEIEFDAIEAIFELPGGIKQLNDPCQSPDGEIDESCRPPERQRLKPTFYEEERQNFTQRGFSETFLEDALSGAGSHLGGASLGGSNLEVEGIEPISAQDRGVFDPTDVIIPRAPVKR
jgi:hypothetical protein